MAGIRPYFLFGHTGTPAGGYGDYHGAWFTADEAVAEAGSLALAVWQVVVHMNEELELVTSSASAPVSAAPVEMLEQLPGTSGN